MGVSRETAGFGTKRRNAPLPPEEAKHYASLVWKADPQLPQLLSELSEKQRNGPAENAFKKYLQTRAAENFDQAVARKGAHIAPPIFLSRGVLFADKGDMQSAKNEFLAELEEASQLPYSEARDEAVITAYYDLAVAEAGLGNSKEALTWIGLAEEEQDKLGRTVLPEITPARQKLESMATSFSSRFLTLPAGAWMDRQQAPAELEGRTLQYPGAPSLAPRRP